jgi:phage FluMu gp28-like protein
MPIVRELHKGSDDLWVFEEPVTTGWYAIGADWAKEDDMTVIVVFRLDESVRRCVYLRRVNRRPYPEMAGMFNDTMKAYNAVGAHDATGLGNVVNDLLDDKVIKFTMAGEKRKKMLVEYISCGGAVEVPAAGEYAVVSGA